MDVRSTKFHTTKHGSFEYEVCMKLRPYGKVPRQRLDEIKDWLIAEIGGEYVEWKWIIEIRASIEHGNIDVYSFRREEDKVKFILRWM